jgi:acetolactate synthase-1/2/3 large subunit
VIKAADYFVEEMLNIGIKDVFLLSGGANLPVVDAIDRNPNMGFMCTHHEQTASMAAESYARVNESGLGACLVTTGPGGTNAMTGVLGAWQDSIPVIYLSGQVRSDRLEDKPIRQLSTQGLDIVALVEPITKYAVTVRDVKDLRYHFEKAIYLATHGRPGPVWLDLPLDVMSQMIEPEHFRSFSSTELVDEPVSSKLEEVIEQTVQGLAHAKRPLLFLGTGVRLAKAEDELTTLLDQLGVPYVCSWNIQDAFDGDDPLYCGSPGTFGTRFANFAVQNTDFLLAVGTRLSIAQTGHNYRSFARGAKKVVVDIDINELEKGTVIPDVPVCCDAKIFLRELLKALPNKAAFPRSNIGPWLDQCMNWKRLYPIVLDAEREQRDWVNSYVFVQTLSRVLTKDDVITLGVGTAFTGTFQSFITKRGQKLFHSGGAAAMGYCLPSAIGACVANDRQRTICITGDGCIQLNIQELQTIVGENLPIKIFMYNNRGYHAIRTTQTDWFEKRYAASSESGGLSFPDMQKIVKAYGIPSMRLANQENLAARIEDVLNTPGPVFCELMMDPDQRLEPYLSYSTREDGSRYPAPLEDLAPRLGREELKKNMIIEPWVEPITE